MSDASNRANRPDESTSDGENRGESSWPERLLVVLSVVFTIVLFSFVIWQAATTPAMADPTATVADADPLADGDVKVTVSFRNPQATGLVVATVEVDCDTPPPELTFENVPADDRRTGHVICPPGTTNPTATVSTWIEA